MTPVFALVGTLGFVVAALLYFFVFVLVATARLRSWRFNRAALALALAITVVWAAVSAYSVGAAGAVRSWLPTVDAAHSAAWLVLVATMMSSSATGTFIKRLGYVLAAAACVSVALVAANLRPGTSTAGSVEQLPLIALLALLALPVFGLLALEQVFRNADFAQQRALRSLVLGLGLMFTINVFIYADAVLFRAIDWDLWPLRGIVNAAVAPLILLAVKRLPQWEPDLFVSRHVVFYTTSVGGAGLYLLLVGLGGFLLRGRGESWDLWLQVAFLLCASAIFYYVLFSTTVRRRLKVFIAKHFYRNRYDYREEWLRLIRTLASAEHQTSLTERGVKALADIIGSSRGELWFEVKRGRGLEGYGGLAVPPPAGVLEPLDPLVQFLRQTHWVVDTDEYQADPERYANAFVTVPDHLSKPSIFVPLIHADDLIGVVRLDRPSGLGRLSYEDHDLLRTAGQQVAIFLAQQRAQDELGETRQFQAFSKLTAFLMHDLKNMVAQHELVVGNARRFKRNPEFVDDAISTIETSVGRMRALLERLRAAGGAEHVSRVDLHKMIYEVCNACADRHPVPVIASDAAVARASIDRDKLHMALVHAIRNAQDATDANGRIELRLKAVDGKAWIEVADTGVGMDAEFVRSQLFRPFESTKGAKGMGIGAYQIRETLRAAGGDVIVESEPGRGTTLRLYLPLAEAAPSGLAVA
jgi:putative PEP-CTERM system histidine kinase